MALSQTERNALYEIKAQVGLINERQAKLFESQDKLKIDVRRLNVTIYENGLNTRVRELHEWMLQQKQNRADDLKHTQDLNLLGFRVSAERKSQIITGIIAGMFTLAGILLGK